MENLNNHVHTGGEEAEKQVVFGGMRVGHFIKKVVVGEHVDGKKYSFNSELICKLHDLVYMTPGQTGSLRQTDSTTLGGESVSSSKLLEDKMYQYGQWLERQIDKLKQDSSDPILALEVAAAAHYGLTMHEFHPFDNGNGRTARALVNAILMINTCELMDYNIAVPPVPILRSVDQNSKDDRYVRSLRAVRETNTLNPLMNFIAQRWVENLHGRLEKSTSLNKRTKSKQDQYIINVWTTRLDCLQAFIESGQSKYKSVGTKCNRVIEYQVYPVPNYFETVHVKFSNAEINAKSF